MKKFIEELDYITSSRATKSINFLREYGYLLDMPDSKSLGKGLFELRTQGKVKVRILYIFHKNRAWIIHGFVKKAWKINIRDINYARQIQKEINLLA